jgi:hypothetical protein
MTDDDPKYFNAWVNVMGNKLRKLLCTWHVIKNWNVEGRAQIKKVSNFIGLIISTLLLYYITYYT